MSHKISAISVVHNEGEYLADAMEALDPYVDDFVVIDQASTDDTVAIARNWTDKVYLFPRVYYPYAYVHEAALMATHEWVLKMDPDERWDVELLEMLGDLIDEQNPDSSSPDIVAFRIWYGGDDKSHATRLWRKSRVIWTDSFDAAPYNVEDLVIKAIGGDGRIRNLRTRESSAERYRLEGARRLLERYGDTEVEPYKNFCNYYRQILSGEMT